MLSPKGHGEASGVSRRIRGRGPPPLATKCALLALRRWSSPTEAPPDPPISTGRRGCRSKKTVLVCRVFLDRSVESRFPGGPESNNQTLRAQVHKHKKPNGRLGQAITRRSTVNQKQTQTRSVGATATECSSQSGHRSSPAPVSSATTSAVRSFTMSQNGQSSWSHDWQNKLQPPPGGKQNGMFPHKSCVDRFRTSASVTCSFVSAISQGCQLFFLYVAWS